MPRLALSSMAMVFVLLVFVALFATEASAKYIKAKLCASPLLFIVLVVKPN